MRILVYAAAAVFAHSAGGRAAISAADAVRLAAAAQVAQDLHPAIPQDVWSRARCVAVIPGAARANGQPADAAPAANAAAGKGVMSCRAGERWSAPVFVQLARGGSGQRAGSPAQDIVLLVMNESGVQKVLENDVTLGTGVTLAPGPVAESAARSEAQPLAEILAYAHTPSRVDGAELSSSVLRADREANTAAYGQTASPRTILATSDISAPTQATAFLHALGAGRVATAPAAASAGRPSTPAPGAGATASSLSNVDADLRARIVQMQQAIDRLLAEAPPSSAGTIGTAAAADATAAGGTVVVDRARLVQLRQQLDAMLAAIDRR